MGERNVNYLENKPGWFCCGNITASRPTSNFMQQAFFQISVFCNFILTKLLFLTRIWTKQRPLSDESLTWYLQIKRNNTYNKTKFDHWFFAEENKIMQLPVCIIIKLTNALLIAIKNTRLLWWMLHWMSIKLNTKLPERRTRLQTDSKNTRPHRFL